MCYIIFTPASEPNFRYPHTLQDTRITVSDIILYFFFFRPTSLLKVGDDGRRPDQFSHYMQATSFTVSFTHSLSHPAALIILSMQSLIIYYTACCYYAQEFVGHMTSKGHVMQMNDVIREHVSRTRQQLRTMRTDRRRQQQQQERQVN